MKSCMFPSFKVPDQCINISSETRKQASAFPVHLGQTSYAQNMIYYYNTLHHSVSSGISDSK